jgi:hypothetical protein
MILNDRAAAYIAAAADLRDRRGGIAGRCGTDWMAATDQDDDLVHLWVTPPENPRDPEEPTEIGIIDSGAGIADDQALAEHIAAETNPAHVTAEINLWRTVVLDMETHPDRFKSGDIPYVWTACWVAAWAYMGGTP